MILTKPPLDVLVHYGVKGMKWGVRKQYERQAQQAHAEYAKVGHKAIAYAYRDISQAEYKTLSSKPIHISQTGGTFKRIVKDNNAKLRDGMAYVTRDPQDHNNYVALFPPEGSDRNKKKYMATVQVSNAVVSPGMKTRVDTFIRTLDKDIPVPNSSQVVKGRAFITGASDRVYEAPEIRALSNHDLGLQYYQKWVQTQHTNDPINQAYTQALIKKGYNAIIDDADAGMLSQTPIILFPKEAGARITEITPITKDDILIAKANLKAPTQTNR